MADISKCFGTGCNQKNNCYRYTAPSGYYQSFFNTPPLNESTQECDYFWEDSEYNVTILKETHETIEGFTV